MSRKHNTKHGRSTSHYPDRLADRGESSRVDTHYRGMDGQPVRMPFFDADGRKVTSAAQARPARKS